ncbi:MAG: DUF72 domain-containing protein [Planctomycetota bacterium]
MSAAAAARAETRGEVRYGTAGWSFADWYGTFYPAPATDDGPGALFTGVLDEAPDEDLALARREPLRYYARYFDAVEVNASFYRIPSPRSADGWARQTERRAPGEREFLFAVKLNQAFTHEDQDDPREVQAMRDCLAPLADRGRLAAVLAQFPQHFAWGERSRERLARLRELFRELPLAVEVRHASWDQDEAFEFLAAHELCAASIDQPQGRNTITPTLRVTRPELAYVRLHGRNREAWFAKGAGRDQKYDYLYGEGELDEWSARIKAFSGLAARTLVIANNHYRGKAPANALELRARGGEQVTVPRALARTYARLERLR